MNAFIVGVICLGLGFGAGWYVKARHIAGIMSDWADAGRTVAQLRDHLKG